MERRKVSLIKGNGQPILSQKIGRNEPCSCGSGRKAKNCHGTETRFFMTPLPKLTGKTKEA